MKTTQSSITVCAKNLVCLKNHKLVTKRFALIGQTGRKLLNAQRNVGAQAIKVTLDNAWTKIICWVKMTMI